MGEKKRKSLDSAHEAPKKKTRKSEAAATPLPTTVESKSLPNAAALSKKSRKRAADFLSDDEVTEKPAGPTSAPDATTIPSKKSKKGRKVGGQLEPLTADGVNGVVEHAGKETVETSTKASKIKSSMQQEAQNTVDNEIAEGFASFSDDQKENLVDEQSEEDENEDAGAALLTGFDSDSADEAQDEGDLSKTPGMPQYKKTQKKLRQAKEKAGEDVPGTVYVGRIPHGFYETEMRAFFSQFGDITRLRLSRNRQTGASKHFAFIEFGSSEVAKIVAEAMDNYLMFGHILKCKYAPTENLHPDTFKGANKKYRKIPHAKLEAARLAEPKSVEQWQKKNDKERKKRNKKAKLLKETMGYEMLVKALADPAEVSKQKQLEANNAKSIDDAADRQLRVENGDTPAVKKPGAEKDKEEAVSSPAPAPKKEKKTKEKYVAPTHKKQAEKANFAKDHPEEHKKMKQEKEAEKLRQRAEKKAKKTKSKD